MNYFEPVSRFADANLDLPERKTEFSAGYDMKVAEDIVVPSYLRMIEGFKNLTETDSFLEYASMELDEMSNFTKINKFKPTLVSTGMKCHLDPGYYLELSIRSSSPLKYWLILANGVGIIDRDYYDNESNEGLIYFQLINLSPFNIQLKKGDIIGQGIIKSYSTTSNDIHGGERKGGFGSTTNV